MHRRLFVSLLLLSALLPLGCVPSAQVRSVSKQTIDYHVVPKLRFDSTNTAHELVLKTDGPLLSLVLEQPGKPRHVAGIFVRAYGLEHPVPGAYYDIRYRHEEVLLEGSRAVTGEIVWVRLNGRQLYPCGGIFRDPCGRPRGCLFCRGKLADSVPREGED